MKFKPRHQPKDLYVALLPLLASQVALIKASAHSHSLVSWLSVPVVLFAVYRLLSAMAQRLQSNVVVQAQPAIENPPTEMTDSQEQTDPLTGLASRLTFRRNMAKQLSLSQLNRQPLTLLYFDLDNFKYVNEKHGYEIGDKLLKSISRRLSHLVSLHFNREGERPWLARLSGDEFAVVLPLYSSTQAEPLVHKIQELFWDGFRFELGTFPISASIGIASFPLDGHTTTQLVSNAEMAMNQAKSLGLNHYKVYSYHLARIARRRHEIEHELKHADYDQEFTLHFMPIIDSQGQVHSCEALLRWTSAHLGTVSPDEFIPIAEASGLFQKVDLWVARQAMQSYSKLQQLFGPDVKLAINVSSAELSGRGFYRAFTQLAQQYEVPPQGIEVEITETYAKEHSEAVLDRLANLQSKGFSIAIDDFGSGYTSLLQVMDFPVDRVKFDKSLVERLCEADKHELLRSLVQLCHKQQITIVAEGVESSAQKAKLLGAGVDYLQGYLFAKPMPMTQLKRWCHQNMSANHDGGCP